MDSFELNKIAGAVILAALVFFGLNETSNLVFYKPEPEKPGYEVAIADSSAGEQVAEAPKEEVIPIGQLLSTASVEGGEKAFRKCVACHTVAQGDKNKVGPNLWDIVGRQVAVLDEFAYSSALKEKGGEWTYEFLDCFLAKPRECVKGTKMVFAGISKVKERADLILYLRSLSDNPKPLPDKSAANSEGAATEENQEDKS